MDNENKPQVFTRIGRDRVVSTIWRQSSVMMGSPPWFPETLVWSADPETGKLLNILAQGEGLDFHFEMCRRLVAGEPLEAQDDV